MGNPVLQGVRIILFQLLWGLENWKCLSFLGSLESLRSPYIPSNFHTTVRLWKGKYREALAFPIKRKSLVLRFGTVYSTPPPVGAVVPPFDFIKNTPFLQSDKFRIFDNQRNQSRAWRSNTKKNYKLLRSANSLTSQPGALSQTRGRKGGKGGFNTFLSDRVTPSASSRYVFGRGHTLVSGGALSKSLHNTFDSIFLCVTILKKKQIKLICLSRLHFSKRCVPRFSSIVGVGKKCVGKWMA